MDAAKSVTANFTLNIIYYYLYLPFVTKGG
jgi:hypothetical protein